MSEKAPRNSTPDKPSTAELLEQVDDLAGDRFRVTANDHLQLKAGTTALDAEGNVTKVGGRFESKHQLETIAAFEDEIRLGMKAKEIASVTPAIDAALHYAHEQVALLNKKQAATSKLKEAGVMRHALVAANALSDDEAKAMSDDDVQLLVGYMRTEHSGVHEAESSRSIGYTVAEDPNAEYSGEFALDASQVAIAPRDEFTPPVETDEEQTVDASEPDNSAEPASQPSSTGSLEPALPAVIVDRGTTSSSEATPDARTFNVGETVTVKSPNGSFEKGWQVIRQLGATQYRVSHTLKNGTVMTKPVSTEELAEWNPANESGRKRGIIKNLSRYMSERFRKQERSKIRRKALGATAIAVLTSAALFSPRTSHESAEIEVAESVQTAETSLDIANVPVTDPSYEYEDAATADFAMEADAVENAELSSDAKEAAPGEGWSSQLQQMGVPAKDVPGMLKKLLSTDDLKIREWVYTMDNGDPGIAKQGEIPQDVLQSIQKLRD